MIINTEIKNLITALEKGGTDKDSLIKDLVRALDKSFSENSDRYRNPPPNQVIPEAYPVDQNGYAISFDPVEDEASFWDAWSKYGIVVGKSIAGPKQCAHTVSRIHEIFNALSNGAFNIHDPATYDAVPMDANGTSILSRGFFEIYHDDALAQLRQNVRSYIHHALIWGNAKIWTSFDRLGVKLPGHEGGKALPLHVDQNPAIDPHFKTLQGVLALVDCPAERGTFRGVPGSRNVFQEYTKMPGGIGEFVELDPQSPLSHELEEKAQAFPLRAGDLVSWDSRTTHANTDNISQDPRMVFYVAAGLAKEDNATATAARRDAYKTGMATSKLKVPEALLRASIKPRFTDPEIITRVRQPENLTLLGQLLYGIKRYDEIITPPAP